MKNFITNGIGKKIKINILETALEASVPLEWYAV